MTIQYTMVFIFSGSSVKQVKKEIKSVHESKMHILRTVILVVKPYFVHGCELNIHPRKCEMLKYEEFQLPEHVQACT